ncbi:MAG TPA: hypothetical protein VHF07_02275, partial [Nitrospiraceae bacterium]|nr:hypothetical protein [Nitrospiraceae bacterium]
LYGAGMERTNRDPLRRGAACLLLAGVLWSICAGMPVHAEPGLAPLQRARVFLQAADYRRAIEACQDEVRARPSAASYVYLTYVYLALDQYLDYLAKTDQWVTVELVYLNLASGRTEDLTDPPDVLARIAKEVVQQALQRQSDIAAAMAKRLDEAAAQELWKAQTAWRQARPTDWWFGVPPEWSW